MAFLSLYRKYRPQSFQDLVGQEHIVKTLENALKHNRISHAYLFAGPRGTGKTSTAKVFAQALNCTERKGLDPCGECDNCRKIQSGQSIDVIEIDAASNRGIDEIRDLREKVKFYPSEGSYKVYIIDEVHMLTKGAFNALLKTLEEPPENVIFILATTEPHRVIDTILSRCQRFDFTLLSQQHIRGRLEYICRQEEVEYEKEALNIITRSSNGGMRDAISLLDQAISFTNSSLTAAEIQEMLGKVDQRVLNDFFGYLVEHNTAAALKLVNELVDLGNSINVFVSDLIEYTRRLLLIKECGPGSGILDAPDEILTALEETGRSIEAAKLFGLLEILTGIERDLTFTDQPRLILELGVMKMASPASDSTLEGLQARVAVLEEKLKTAHIDDKEHEDIQKPDFQKRDIEGKDIHNQNTDKDKNAIEAEKEEDTKTIKKDAQYKDKQLEDEKIIDEQIEDEQIDDEQIDDEQIDDEQIEDEQDKEDEAVTEENKTGVNGLSLEKVKKAWPQVLSLVKAVNISVQAYLLEGEPVQVKEDLIIVKFPADKKFHLKGAEREAGMIKKVVSKVMGQPCQLQFVGSDDNSNFEVKKKIEPEEESLVDKVINQFGGEIIKVDFNVLDNME